MGYDNLNKFKPFLLLRLLQNILKFKTQNIATAERWPHQLKLHEEKKCLHHPHATVYTISAGCTCT